MSRQSVRPKLCIGVPKVPSTFVQHYRELPGFVARIEESGAAQVGLPDRLLMTANMEHPGGGSYDHPPTEPYVEPLVMLAAIAVATRTIRLTTSILIAPLRQPVVLAKAAATVDVISDGRLDLALGAGWFEPEFRAVAVPASERFARLEECIHVCRILWSESPATFHGRWCCLDEVTSRPAPVAGRVPIWIGTQARPSARTATRIAQWADGWAFSSRSTLDDIQYGAELLVAACEKIGRDPGTIPLRAQVRPLTSAAALTTSDLDEAIENSVNAILPYARAGVEYVTCGFGPARDVDEAAYFVKGVHDQLAG
jgi:probable F420-dependent oxidoreductase